MRYAFFDLTTGHFTGQFLTTDDEAMLALNTPTGAGAVPDEGIDFQSQRVDLATGNVVDYQPPAPSDTALLNWAWDGTAKRWVSTATLAALQADACTQIDTAAGAARLRYITEVPGQEGVYLRKAEQARAYQTAGYTGTVPPYIAAEAQATDATAQAAADNVLAIADQWDNHLSPAIEGARIGGKFAVTHATTLDAVATALSAALAQLAAI